MILDLSKVIFSHGVPTVSIKALSLLITERARQQIQEGHTPAHDDQHTEGQLALLAAAYALMSRGRVDVHLQSMVVGVVEAYDWEFTPKDPIRDLVRAGALILAELERRLRLQEASAKPKTLAEIAVEAAITAGKLQEDQRGWALEYFERDPGGFRRYVGHQLPRWQSHKRVWGDKIEAAVDESPSMHGHWDLLCGASVAVSLQLARRVPEGVNPVGGYYVRYNDGFESWSPAEAFERGYTRLP